MSESNLYISVDEAREAILSSITPLGPERAQLNEIVGRRLADPINAPADAPAFDNSAMDGFAFQHVGLGEPFEVVGESAAGVPFRGTVGSGQAIRIMTGAAVPPGCDTVAMREVCSVDGTSLVIDSTAVAAPGQHIRRRATFMRQGQPVMEAGHLLAPADVGLLASFGRTVVAVRRRARVGILTTGSELVEPDGVLADGQIYNSNAYMVEALVRESGGVPIVAPIVADDERATRAAIRDIATGVDLVITIGGVSAGDYDFVRTVLEEFTGGMTFWKVRMKPGKPLAFGTLVENAVPVIGLPGNPVSSFVAFHQFVRPALAVLHGAPPSLAPLRRLRLRTVADIKSTPHRREYVIGHAQPDGDGLVFAPHANPSSGNVVSMSACDALGVVEEGVAAVAAGDSIVVELL